MGILNDELRNEIDEVSKSVFIPFFRIAYTSSHSPEVKENEGRFFTQEGKGDEASFTFFDSFTGIPVGYRGVITSHKPGHNTAISSKRCSLIKKRGGEKGSLFNSSSVDLFIEASEEEGLEVKNNVEVLFRITSIDGKPFDGYMIHLYKSSTLKNEFQTLDELVEDHLMDFTVKRKQAKNTWFVIEPTVTGEVYEEPEDLEDTLAIFYGWK